MPSPARKKKGIARAVKGPRRARNSTKRSRRPSSRKGSNAHAAVIADGDSDESDSGPYCICRGPDNHKFMIACDKCEEWFHGDCIGVDKWVGENLIQRYICPNCTDGHLYVTRYKKTCSLEGCEKPARLYNTYAASIFCSDEHRQFWWDDLVAMFPNFDLSLVGDHVLTQDELVALLDGGEIRPRERSTWQVGGDPFGIPLNFWETVNHTNVLTQEELDILSYSATTRHEYGEEIILCKKMLELIEMAARRREGVIASSSCGPRNHILGKEFCGYDFRLDSVGAPAAFASFIRSPTGEAIFRARRLQPPEPVDTPDGVVRGEPMAGMCMKKKCKPHMQWTSILSKMVRHQIKELVASAKEQLDVETRVRDCAAERYQRRSREKNWVVVDNSIFPDPDTDMD